MLVAIVPMANDLNASISEVTLSLATYVLALAIFTPLSGYLFNPLGLAGPLLWGLPVVATEAQAFEGRFLTGAFRTGAQLFDREDANVVISTENADDFEKNLISIRCEERVALAVKRPEAFIYGPFTVPTPEPETRSKLKAA